jgi:spore germination cell wall hydrolase CwlJ-like protein
MVMRLVTDDIWGIIAVWQEAEGEIFLGKVAVAEVILRRAKLKYNSDGTIAGTVSRRYQFSSFNDDSHDNLRLIRSLQIDDDDPIVKECISAWSQAKTGPEVVPGAVLYANLDISSPAWALATKTVGKIDHHTFFLA